MAGTNSYVVRAGNLRKRLSFQTRATTQDVSGQQVNTWTTAFTVWGEIEPISGRELLAAQAVQSDVTHTVTVRYRSELAVPKVVAAMRIMYGTRIFNITSGMNEDERNRLVTLQVSEGANLG